jgi:hypothetical protein
MNIAAGIRWDRWMLPRQLIRRASRDACSQRFEGEGGSARACAAGFAEVIAIIGPVVCGVLAQGTT